MICAYCKESWRKNSGVNPRCGLCGKIYKKSVNTVHWEKISRREIHKIISAGDFRQCPSCMTGIQKNHGCKHIKCACGYDFYWSKYKYYIYKDVNGDKVRRNYFGLAEKLRIFFYEKNLKEEEEKYKDKVKKMYYTTVTYKHLDGTLSKMSFV